MNNTFFVNEYTTIQQLEYLLSVLDSNNKLKLKSILNDIGLENTIYLLSWRFRELAESCRHKGISLVTLANAALTGAVKS